MVEKLQGRLIKITTISISVVLSIVILFFAIFNIIHIINEADSTLKEYAKIKKNEEAFSSFTTQPLPTEEAVIGTHNFFKPFNFRYIIEVILDGESIIIKSQSDLDDDERSRIKEAAFGIFESEKNIGFHNFFRYLRSGNVIYAINTVHIINGFVISLFLIIASSIVGILAVLFLLSIFSRRIIKPIILSYEKQKRFITDAGHEIKTPLSIIDADVSLIELENGNSEWSQDIKKQVKRLTELTNDLIFLSKMEEKESLSFIAVPFSLIAKEAVASFLSSAKQKGMDIALTIEPSFIDMVGDGKSLERLLYILLDNAVKYGKEGTKIDVSLNKEQKEIVLKVKNKTDGKNLENLDSIFDRFYRADTSRSGAVKGFGIGLAIAKAITEIHSGKISAINSDTDEILFIAVFPIRRANA